MVDFRPSKVLLDLYRPILGDVFSMVEPSDTIDDRSRYNNLLAFRSPELLSGGPHGPAVDIWAWGVIVCPKHPQRMVGARLMFIQVTSMLLQQPGKLIFHTSPNKILSEQESELQRQHLATFGSATATLTSHPDGSQKAEASIDRQNDPDHEHNELALIWQDAVKGGVVSQRDAEFFSKVMKLKPEQRPDAHELLVDPWFGTKHPEGTYYCTGCDAFGTHSHH